jgi:predicted Fe-Mo cluster-binding NifX family protein
MKIAVTSQNFRTISGHAGKTRRFLAYELEGLGPPRELERLDLPQEMMMHEFRGTEHPLQRFDALITGGAGEGFVRRLGAWGVKVAITDETDPLKAVLAYARGDLVPGVGAHAHAHHHDHDDGHGGCGGC